MLDHVLQFPLEVEVQSAESLGPFLVVYPQANSTHSLEVFLKPMLEPITENLHILKIYC